MLKQLTIKNLAIIDDITIDFDENLNVLTGETGAGKSIIIDAISLIFGARANSDIITNGKDSAFISAALYLNEKLSKFITENYDIDVMDEFIISRTISNTGKSSVKINGVIVPLHTVNEISSLLIDISSQNESQYLFNHKNHLNLLDTFINTKENNFLCKYSSLFEEYDAIKKEYDNLTSKQIDENELEFLQFKYKELKDYNYTQEDEEDIQKEYKALYSYSQNIEAFEEVINYLDDDYNGCMIQLYNAIKQLNKLASNSKVGEYSNKFNSIYLDLSDLVDNFKKEFNSDSVDLSRIDALSNEITKINRLKRKYNTTSLLEYKNKLLREIEDISNREVLLSKLKKQLDEKYLILKSEADRITKIRKKYALELSELVISELKDLYLNDATFSIQINPLNSLSKVGNDDVEFYMSANKGIEERPLIKVASGGEVSRIMLGLKSVFTKLSMVDIIIFDEIDTGVSGKVALAMGKKMEKIAKSAQVLAITHLPQVAAMSDHHFYIYKVNDGNKTKTIVKPLDDNQKEHEVARLLSGNDVSDSFIIAAKELISSK